MKRIYHTGIETLGRSFRVTNAGAILVKENGVEEVIWWPPLNIYKELMNQYKDWYYFLDDEGYFIVIPPSKSEQEEIC